ncbi:autotransporter domain-containing protein [Pseudomonas sp. CAN2814]|uniref:autotransporter outer membrane beta-barrel domain-containing protein n=1 Tax=Pseudomonas sp. CAN1 TaxID=3046726 RepID=UPI0026488E3D|nr:autotransporter outer membrane beta-barrel domain-containing protein [Pseudomonas sp. CAN1]MDN6859031.1 autotransporter domain-containing protein [Pseudomonas sp. CAN1]
MTSTWNLDEQQKSQVMDAMKYWANVITPAPGIRPAILNVGTFNTDDNAAGSSGDGPDVGGHIITQLEAALTGRDPGALKFGADGYFVLGKMGFSTQASIPSQIPLHAEPDLTATALHELAHGLGLTNTTHEITESTDPSNPTYTPQFDDKLNAWAIGLRDDNGNPAHAGQTILCTGCANPYSADAFDVRKDQGYFTGEHVSEVLAGAMPGVPVKILGTDGSVDDDYMSHSELKNSLMSHQQIRNYVTFMEAELAVLQDLGFTIDRRNFFGYSVYGDNLTLVNQNGYFQRNAEGTAYLAGQANTTTQGLGLHVYGSHNQIHQAADLLANGAGAAGIRVDGVGNTLTIDPSTTVHADGLNGRGVLFTYGSNHNFVQRGEVQALGEGGIGAEFNFGNNLLGNDSGFYSSFNAAYADLQGALVNNVDISGRLAGADAAISIASNAAVRNINFLNGAKVHGDIRSDYVINYGDGTPFLTQLTFGNLADDNGRALAAADPNFKFSFDDDIDGVASFAIKAVGGTTTLNGSNTIYSVDVAEGATLGGSGNFTLNKAGTFVNAGTVAPDGTMAIKGDYTQAASGKLLIDVDAKGQHDTLTVSGKAKLDGQLSVTPERGWYAPSWKLNTASLLKAGSTEGAFSQVNADFDSPTLTLLSTPLANGSYNLSLTRAADAYSQYAQDRNGERVGEALSSIAPLAGSDLHKLYTTLDFSAADGSTIATALDQLSPSAYSAMVASSVQREQQVADAISKREPGKLALGQWQTFIQPFGGNTRQNGDSHSVGYTGNSYGVIFGAETVASAEGALVVGLHGAASKQTVSLKDPLSGDGNTTALELGVHARYALDPMVGPYMLGSARVGYEEGELKRKLNFADYSTQNKADWNGTSASVVGGGGYRFMVNENVSVGPIATLTYTSLWRDSTHEKGADGTTLKLDSQQFDSLRSSIGLSSAMAFPLGAGQAIKAEAQITWNHELLDTDVLQDATFANYPATGFNSKNTAFGRDSMGLGGSVRYQLSKDIDIGAGVSSDLFRTGYNAVSGNLSLDWRF